MALVKSFVSERGNITEFYDDSFRDCTPEEITRRKANFDECVRKMYFKCQEKKPKVKEYSR